MMTSSQTLSPHLGRKVGWQKHPKFTNTVATWHHYCKQYFFWFNWQELHSLCVLFHMRFQSRRWGSCTVLFAWEKCQCTALFIVEVLVMEDVIVHFKYEQYSLSSYTVFIQPLSHFNFSCLHSGDQWVGTADHLREPDAGRLQEGQGPHEGCL